MNSDVSHDGVKVIAIAAVAKNGVIGKGLQLPWNIPEDMKFFRSVTKGHIVVMGRKTFDAMKKPMANRDNVVISRDQNWTAPGVRVFQDFGNAIEILRKEAKSSHQNIFILGGAQIYRESFRFLDELWLTEIDAEMEGDIYFPDYRCGVLERPEFKKVESRPQMDPHPANIYFSFNKYAAKNN